MNDTLKSIMKREGWSAARLSKPLKISDATLRRMLTGAIRLPADTFQSALEEMGYKIMIVKKEDIV